MKDITKKEILGFVVLSNIVSNIKIVAVETAKNSFTAYISPTHNIASPDKRYPAQAARYDRNIEYNNIAVATRGIILEKEQALAFFPKLKKRKYIKTKLNPELQG